MEFCKVFVLQDTSYSLQWSAVFIWKIFQNYFSAHEVCRNNELKTFCDHFWRNFSERKIYAACNKQPWNELELGSKLLRQSYTGSFHFIIDQTNADVAVWGYTFWLQLENIMYHNNTGFFHKKKLPYASTAPFFLRF